MVIKTQYLNGLDNKEIKVKEDIKPKYPFDLYSPYARICVCGSSGSGKTNAVLIMWEKMYPYIDKTYVVSPTIHNDAKQKQGFLGKDGKGRENVLVFDEPSNQLLQEIYDDLKRINKDYHASIKTREAYERWKRVNYDVDRLAPKDLVLLDRIGYDLSNLPWKHNRRFCGCLFIDDCQGTDLLRGKLFEAMVIKLRHYSCNLFVNVQTFRGISPNVRRNMTGYMVFKTIDTTLLKSIFEETQLLWKSFDDFLERYEFATENRHNFLYIDTQDDKHPVRKDFNTPIYSDVPV